MIFVGLLRIVGPSCLHACLTNVIPIPNNNSAVFNIAMRGVVICSTNLDAEYKVKSTSFIYLIFFSSLIILYSL